MMMFVAAASFLLSVIILITLRDWVHHTHRSQKAIRKTLKMVSQQISLQNWEGAEKELAPLLETGKAGKEGWLCEIQILKGKRETQKALKKCFEATKLYPEELQFQQEKGILLFELGKFDEAAEAFKNCLSILRNESDLIPYAEAAMRIGNSQLTLELLHPFLENSQNETTRILCADAFYDLKEFSHALSLYQQVIPPTHHVYLQLAHTHLKLGHIAEAEKQFRTLHDKNPADIEAILGIGNCLQNQQQHMKAFLVYQTGLSWSRDLRLLQQTAYAALSAQRYSQAESYFFEMIQRLTREGSDNPNPQLLAYYGLSLEGQKKWEEAEQLYLNLIEDFPLTPHGYRALAWMFGVGVSQKIAPEKGLLFAYKALELQNDEISWEILSACIARRGEFDKAYQIQLSLAKQDKDGITRNRRQQVLRTLRKKEPLHDQQVLRSLVA